MKTNEMYGEFVLTGLPFDCVYIWKADTSIDMPASEQYRDNKEKVPGFKAMKLSLNGLGVAV